MFSKLIEAFILGLVGGAVPGPILTGTFTEILHSTFRKALRIILYALLIETVGAMLILFVFYSLGVSALVVKFISIVGALVLFWLGWQVWNIKEVNIEAKEILTFPKIVLLTALNSGYWVFWVTVGTPRALQFNENMRGGELVFLIVFEIAWLIATMALAYIFYQFRPLLERKNLVATTFKVLGVVLVLLGIKTLLTAFL